MMSLSNIGEFDIYVDLIKHCFSLAQVAICVDITKHQQSSSNITNQRITINLLSQNIQGK